MNETLAAARPKLLKAAYAILNGTREFDVDSTAEDMVQEAMLACWQNGTATDANLYCMVVNRCKNFLQAADLRAPIKGMDMDRLSFEKTEPEEDGRLDPRVSECFGAARRSLSPTLLSTFMRHYHDGDSCEEIAEADGSDAMAIRARLKLARHAVRARIKKSQKRFHISPQLAA